MSADLDISLGPIELCTISCPDLSAVLPLYCEHLHLEVAATSPISAELAKQWDAPELESAASVILANRLGEPWLRLVENRNQTSIPEPMRFHGWMSLEVSVADVDSLAASLKDTAFTVLRPPADLDLSDQLRACQVQGPCGELFYFTEIKGKVPGFDLKPARCAVDKLFIPVLCCPDRIASRDFYGQFTGTRSSTFDTIVTVVNQSWNLPLNTRHPLATVSLRGGNVIEIDELDMAAPRPETGGIPSGIASITFAVSEIESLVLPWHRSPSELACAPYNGRKMGVVIGPAGEWVELVERG